MPKSPSAKRPPLDEPYERFHWTTLRAEVVRRRLGHDFRRSSTKRTLAAVLREGDAKAREMSASQAAETSAATAADTSALSAVAPAPAAVAAPSSALSSSSAAPIAPDVGEKKPVKTTAGAKRVNHVPTIVTVGGPAMPAAVASPSGASPRQRVARLVRPRRGCRFRLINVLLSPEFNARWKEMITHESTNGLVVNQFWLDVHVAFNSQNSVFDALHFQDELFGTVSPNVVLSHSAARLFQMWIEIVGMYRSAVRGAQEAVDAGNTTQSFFDFCSGRLDLLYLHMALLLESKLFEFIMSATIPGSDQFPAKIKIIDRTAEGTATPDNKNGARPGAAKSKPAATTAAAAATAPRKRGRPKLVKNVKQTTPTYVMPAPAIVTPGSTAFSNTSVSLPGPQSVSIPAAHSPAQLKSAAPAQKTVTPASASLQSSMARKPAHTPEHQQPAVAAKSAVKPKAPAANVHLAQGKTDPAPGTSTSTPSEAVPAAFVTVQCTSSDSSGQQTFVPVIIKNPEQSGNTGNTEQHLRTPASQTAGASSQRKTSDADSVADSNGEGSASSEDYDAGPQNAHPRRRSSSSKRPREESESSTAIVEVPNPDSRGSQVSSSTDMVPHPHKRYHTSVSTAITAARPSTELLLPPDEWDILEKRLRKVNENIDRCHCALTGVEANVSDSYRQTLEADLRFYSAIKQRLQEQLLVVMQSGY